MLADHLHWFEATSVPAAPLAQEPSDRLVELLVRALYRARYPMVDLAHRDGVEYRSRGVPLTPANRRHPRHRPIDDADPRQQLDAIRIGLTHPADDQRDRRVSRQQLYDHCFKLCGIITDDDPVVHAITPRQLPANGLPCHGVPAHNHDRRSLMAGSAGRPALAHRCRPPVRLHHRSPVFRHRVSPARSGRCPYTRAHRQVAVGCLSVGRRARTRVLSPVAELAPVPGLLAWGSSPISPAAVVRATHNTAGDLGLWPAPRARARLNR